MDDDIFTARQHGDRFGLPGYWTVYRGLDPIHHWNTQGKAERYATARSEGAPHDIAANLAEANL